MGPRSTLPQCKTAAVFIKHFFFGQCRVMSLVYVVSHYMLSLIFDILHRMQFCSLLSAQQTVDYMQHLARENFIFF